MADLPLPMPVGIDFGTSNSGSCCTWLYSARCRHTAPPRARAAIAVWDDASGEARTLALEGEATLTPSMVCFAGSERAEDREGRRELVGLAAFEARLQFPRSVVGGVKRFLGRVHSDARLDGLRSLYPYKLVRSEDGEVSFEVIRQYKQHSKTFHVSAVHVASLIFAHLRRRASEVLGRDVTDAVVAVPAYYNSRQRRAIRDAAEAAGLRVLRLVAEPTAAAMAYGLNVAGAKRVLVLDVGAGTTDATLLRIEARAGRKRELEVEGTHGNTLLGGDDVTGIVFQHVLEQLRPKERHMVNHVPALRRRLWDECEAAKIRLSSEDRVRRLRGRAARRARPLMEAHTRADRHRGAHGVCEQRSAGGRERGDRGGGGRCSSRCAGGGLCRSRSAGSRIKVYD